MNKILLALSLTALLGQPQEIPPLPKRPVASGSPNRRNKRKRGKR